MTLLNKLYPFLPVWMQNIVVSVYGYNWKKRRFGDAFNSYYTAFKQRETYNHENWKLYVITELQKLLKHAYHEVPYYQNGFNKIGLREVDFKTFSTEDLIKLPFLVKDNLREHGDSTLLAKKVEPKGEFYSSSGSTGTPTKILFSENMHQKWSAAFESRIRN
jgi:phenylacetate-CoA ligase